MKAPDAVIDELLKKARAILYKDLPDRAWFTQQGRVKAALTLPAKLLDERKVELSSDRYQAILDGVLDTIKANGRRDLGAFPCAYLHHCVEAHMHHHVDEYYEEGKSVRNSLDRLFTRIGKTQATIIPVISTFAQVHATLDVGKRKPKIKPVAAGLQPDLFGASKPNQKAKLHAPLALPPPK